MLQNKKDLLMVLLFKDLKSQSLILLSMKERYIHLLDGFQTVGVGNETMLIE